MEISLGDLCDRLSICNNKIFALENDIRQGKEGKFSLEEIGRRALMIRDINRERVACKNAINDYQTQVEKFIEYKIHHVSEDTVKTKLGKV